MAPSPSPPALSSAAPSIDAIVRSLVTHTPRSPLSSYRPLLARLLPLPHPLFPSLLARLLSSHSHLAPTIALFRHALCSPSPPPFTPRCLPSFLSLLARSGHVASALDLLDEISHSHPDLLCPRSLAALLSSLASASLSPFDAALDAFARAELAYTRAGRPFGAAEFVSLLRAFSSRGRVSEAKALFARFHERLPHDDRTFNTLLLGFKESGNVHAMDLFYHELLARGFQPNSVTYCIRIDAYCKKGKLSDAMDLFDEMDAAGPRCALTLEVITTLIHGATVVKNPIRARQLFDEITKRGMAPDRGAYNALMGAYVRAREFKSAVAVMAEMEAKRIGLDDVSYNTLICGFKRAGHLNAIWDVYQKMVDADFLPRTRTAMLLMKTFCTAGRAADLGLDLWNRLVEKGCCPHPHALDLLVTALCCRDAVVEAYKCFMEMVAMGRTPNEQAFKVLESSLTRLREVGNLAELTNTMKLLRSEEHKHNVTV